NPGRTATTGSPPDPAGWPWATSASCPPTAATTAGCPPTRSVVSSSAGSSRRADVRPHHGSAAAPAPPQQGGHEGEHRREGQDEPDHGGGDRGHGGDRIPTGRQALAEAARAA